MLLRFVTVCMLMILYTVSNVHAQALDRTHVNYTNPLIYGATCTSATLTSTISAVSTLKQTLFITKTDRSKVNCTWLITTDITFNINTTVYIPSGVNINVDSGHTVTFNGPVLIDDIESLQGVGSYVFNYPQTDGLTSYVNDGCLPVVPSSSLTLAAFSCSVSIALANKTVNVMQSAAAVGPLSNGIWWIIVDYSATRTVAGWTRQTGTHYLTLFASTQPTIPTGTLLIAKVTGAGGVITTVEDFRTLSPIVPQQPGTIIVSNVAKGNGTTESPYVSWDGISWADNVTYIFPAGTYAYTVSPNFAHNGIRIIGQGKVIWQYNGTGDAVIFDATGEPDGFVLDVVMENIAINGNAAADRGLFLKAIHRSRFTNVSVSNVGTSALECQWCVINTFNRYVTSTTQNTMTTNPTKGVLLTWDGTNNSSENLFLNSVVEGVNGDGYYLARAQNTRIVGGTAESNAGYGIFLAPEATHNEIFGGDYELNHNDAVNPFYHDIFDSGVGNKFIGVFGGSALHMGSGVKGSTVIGGMYQDIIADSGAISGVVTQATMAHTIVDNTAGALIRRKYAVWNTTNNRFDDLDDWDDFGRSRFKGNVAVIDTDSVVSTNVTLTGPDRLTTSVKGTLGIVNGDFPLLRLYVGIDESLGTLGKAYIGAFKNTVGPITLMIGANGGAVEFGREIAANLTALSADVGSVIYCTDCTVGVPCVGAGSGAWAFKVAAGTWSCPF